MFERFTNDARTVVVTAQQEARALGHRVIGTEHLLLGLLALDGGTVARALAGDGVDADFVRGEIVRRVGPRPPGESFAEADREDAEALKAIGIDLDEVRRAIEASFGAGALHLPREGAPEKRRRFGRHSVNSGHIPFSGRAKKVLELSLREAVRLQQRFIAAEHVMLGLLREGQGLAVLILVDKGVDPDRLRTELTDALRDRAA
jgi:ATP-dependent Clp protease ATP-binding subunit ClpA